MANTTRSFTKGRMNKSTDVRLMQDGEYIDALNVRTNSTEGNNVGSIENSLGNLSLTTLKYIDGTQLSIDARTIGALEDGANERIFWFVHDPSFTVGATGKLDMIVSFDTKTSFLKYHVISVDDGGGVNTTLNFNPQYLITGVDLVENLLFFTDDYNAPRKIDVDASYDVPVANIDQFIDEAILVIKKPPVTSPVIEMANIGKDINYMEDRFLCFAYRYRYSNNEYSATSQFSEPAFFPKDFELGQDTILNNGMQNVFNAAIINFNTGSDLVVGIDLLYKDANDPIIRVIEKFNKKEQGWGANQNKTYVFDNSKIYTILPDSEILRLYDNVPRFAKAQTIMSNRLVYGNYVDGYDLKDSNGDDVRLNYFTELVSEDINSINVSPITKSASNYTINGSVSVADGIVNFDLSDLVSGTSGNILKSGTSINFNITFLYSTANGNIPLPNLNPSFDVSFVFVLNNNYNSVYDLASSLDFLDKVGTLANILPVYDPVNPTSCSGKTFTDIYNCNASSYSSISYYKYSSGISAAGQPISISSSPGSNIISMQFPAVRYVQDVNNPSFAFLYVYYKVYRASCEFQDSKANRSLHSNRDYDVAIAYMDDYNRSSIPLVSNRNTVHVSCDLSDKVNSINVKIPSTQKPPFWATRYKFFIKPDKDTYETIYSQFVFEEVNSGNVYFLLEGENARKVEEGDRYIVKSDTGGATSDCSIATVLEKKSQEEGFITAKNGVSPPSGVYMKMNPEDFSTQVKSSLAFTDSDSRTVNTSNTYFRTSLAASKPDPSSPSNYIDIPIPVNSKIRIEFEYERKGGGFLNSGCEQRKRIYKKTFTSSDNYANLYDWFVGDSVSSTLGQGTIAVGPGGCPMVDRFYPGITTGGLSADLCWNKWFFTRNSINNILSLTITGTRACGSSKNQEVTGRAYLAIYDASDSIKFETIPTDSLPDVFYESSESFPIVNGLHQGNIQNQTTAQSAIIATDFFNCFSFGNGVESYKILDSITGRQFNLGNRVSSVSAEDYKEADRYSDLTYSGVYNDETNVNKLNEFNLGLLNFKPLEDSFGEIQILDGKQTNVLVLQEDKISYVLAGKNILSDAGGGSALTSVPEVLGQQITKSEEYGISHNPESYVKWGLDKFFTDAKRGVVLQMRGNDESAGDQLQVISEMGMRSWFRDLFINDFNTQKLGAFDPYMNEYVLSSNEILLPAEVKCSDCSDYRTFDVQAGNDYTYCVNVGTIVGFTEVKWNIPAVFTGTVTIDVVYNGVTYSSGAVSTSGSISVPKSLTGVTQFDITVSSTGSAVGLEVNTACPDPNNINVRWIVVTSPSSAGTWGTPGTSYDDGSPSPLTSTDIPFVSTGDLPNVSFFDEISGAQGSPSIPTDTSEITMFMQNTDISTFDFNVDTNRFMYLRTDEVYENNPTDISFLLANANVALNPVQTDEFTFSTFAMPEEGSNLYLIWDLRVKQPLFMSHSTVDAADACCGYVCDEVTSEYTIVNRNEQVVLFTYYDALDVLVEDTIAPGEEKIVCSSTEPITVGIYENVDITFTRCGCSS